MKILLLAFLVSVLFTTVFLSVDAQRDANFTKSISKFSFSDKISPIIQEWSSSSEPESFAFDNNLRYLNGKITVYLYLNSSDDLTKIPEGTEIISSSGDIVVANLDARQITQLSKLDFIQRIDSPPLGSLSQQTTIKKNLDKNGKISEIILDWQQSSDPNSFLKQNNLESKDGKLKIYIYLSETDPNHDLSSYIDVLSKSENIVVSYASSQQITQLSQLDFVQRIELPVSSSFPPSPELENLNENDNSYFIYIIPIVVIVAVGLVLYKKKFRVAVKH